MVGFWQAGTTPTRTPLKMPVEENRTGMALTQTEKIAVPDAEKLGQGLEASSRLSEELSHPGVDLRPCIATIAESSLSKGGFPNRGASAVVLASELKRIGKDYEFACRRLEQWNNSNKPPLKPQQLQRAVDNAYAKDYNYSCQHAVLNYYCIGTEECPFATYVQSKKKRYNDLVFVDYGWPVILKPSQRLIYGFGLPHLEKTRRVGRGGLICASQRQIAKICGIDVRYVGEHLEKLAEVGLIEYEPGAPRKWERIASEIRRVFPIPRPKATHSKGSIPSN